MGKPVAIGAQSDQIWFGIVSQSAGWMHVVNLKIIKPPAPLTTPTIPIDHLPAQFGVGFQIEPKPRALWEGTIHEAPSSPLASVPAWGFAGDGAGHPWGIFKRHFWGF